MAVQNPDRKVTVGAFVGAVTAIAAWAIADQTLGVGIIIPAEIGIAVSTVLTFGVQYIVANKA